ECRRGRKERRKLSPLLDPTWVGSERSRELACAGHLHRINGKAPSADFIVQVWTGSESGGADVSDQVTLSNQRLGGDVSRDGGQVRIPGAVAVRMPDLDEQPVSPSAAGFGDDSVGCGADRFAGWGGQVDPGVR